MDKAKKRTSLGSNLLALLFGIFVSLLLAEIVLRIFHPIPYRIKHGKIVLPANQKIVHKNTSSSKLEPVIYYSRNSLGLRGDEMPKDPQHWLKFITIGGSTTECSYNSDSVTWPELLKKQLRVKLQPNVWLDNAGLDGTSAYGHIILLQDHILQLHPDYVIFLTGVNDVENNNDHNFDLYHSDEINHSSIKEFLRSLVKKTELGGLIENMYRYRLAYNKGLVHRVVYYSKEPHITLADAEVSKQLAKQTPYLQSYRQKILKLDSICKANGIKDIFLTQPSLYGSFTDPATGLDFTNIKIESGRNSATERKVLQLYNNVLLNLQAKGKIKVIDMASAMPLNSRFYYDYTHYTSLGTDTLAKMLSDSLMVRLR